MTEPTYTVQITFTSKRTGETSVSYPVHNVTSRTGYNRTRTNKPRYAKTWKTRAGAERWLDTRLGMFVCGGHNVEVIETPEPRLS